MTYTQPLLLLFSGIALIGLIFLRKCRGALIPALAVLALTLLAWPPVALLFSRPLEGRYPIRPFATNLPYEAIVVLSSAVSPPQFERPYYLPDEDTFHRCRFSKWLYDRRPVPVLACGGSSQSNQEPFSLAMRELLLQLGVPGTMIWTEEMSGSTYENALYGSRILKGHSVRRIALVVEATSMPRAQACFRKQGIDVIPAPSDFYEPEDLLLPTWRAIRQNEITLHESLGLAWYRWRGWI